MFVKRIGKPKTPLRDKRYYPGLEQAHFKGIERLEILMSKT